VLGNYTASRFGALRGRTGPFFDIFGTASHGVRRMLISFGPSANLPGFDLTRQSGSGVELRSAPAAGCPICMEEYTSLDTQTQDFATRPQLIRRAIAAHQAWIEKELGVRICEAVIIDGLPNLSQVAVEKVLGISDHQYTWHREARRLRPLVADAQVPPDYPPILSLADDMKSDALEDILGDGTTTWNGFEWREGPLAVRLHMYDCIVVILNVPYHSGPASTSETCASVLVTRRDSISRLQQLFEDLYKRPRTLSLHTIGGRPRRVRRVEWSDLVIHFNVRTLLKNDFESFWQREEWFQENRMPFRRGYLLHGPPGNGKTSAVQAMMNSRDLNAYTLLISLL
jgi:hypothetical protein